MYLSDYRSPLCRLNGPRFSPPLTKEQRRISDDFMKYWHEVVPKQYGIIDHFNHSYPVWHAPASFVRTLDIGAGLGEHLAYEKLTPEQEVNYVAVDLRENMCATTQKRFPRVQVVVGDCQKGLNFPTGYFDRIIAVHVLEHLPDLPRAVNEMHRLCRKPDGTFSVVIPCEGGFANTLARRISAQRIFERRYRQSYRWFIEREHISLPDEIIRELERHFVVVHRRFFHFPFSRRR